MAMERKVLFIEGMTCINCQNRIEQVLKKTAGISEVCVSYEKGQAEIAYDNEILTLDAIIAIIRQLDYIAAEKRKNARWRAGSSIGTLAIIIVLYYLLQSFGILNLLVPSMLADSKMSYGMLFIVGLLTSVHCIAMCGGINLSQCIPMGAGDSENNLKHKIFLPSLLYNTGRVISYTVIGFLLGVLGMLLTGGNGIGIPLLLQGGLKIIAGLFMVITGINLLGIFPVLRRFQIRVPRRLLNRINRKRRKENRPFFVGILNGLMPCGPLQSMQVIALGSGNPVTGAAAMLMFGLGTVPLMLGFGSVVSAIGKKYTQIVMRVGSVLIVVLGLAMLSQGISLAGINSNRTEIIPGETAELNVARIAASGDMQYVDSTLDFGNYPQITVYSGIPVKWTINVSEEVINGCNYKMILNAYGITHEFTPGENVIAFTPGESGTVRYTCWMGMINGTINIIDKERK